MITDLKDLLNSIGYDDLSDNGSFWRTNALYRQGDNKTSLRINKKTGAFQDFVDKRYGSIEELIKLTLGLGDTELKSFYAGNQINLNEIVTRQEKPELTMEKIWDESELSNMLPHYKFYEDRGIDKDALKFFKSGFAHSGSMNQRYVFPIYNMEGGIHGWSGRDMTGKKEAKWKNIGRKAAWVYPAFAYLDKFDSKGKLVERTYPVIEEIRKKREVILVESIGDMLALWQRGIRNVLVTFGLVLSSKLGSFIMSLELDRVVIALNNDIESDINRGHFAAVDMFIDLMHYVDFVKVNIVLPESNDFGSINDDQFNTWVGKKEIIEPVMYENVRDKLRWLRDTGEITEAEKRFGKSLSNYYDQIQGN